MPKIILAALLVSSAAHARNVSSPALPLQPVADVPLGGITTRRLRKHRFRTAPLFIAHLGDSAVIVFDTQKQRVMPEDHRIDDTSPTCAWFDSWRNGCSGM